MLIKLDVDKTVDSLLLFSTFPYFFLLSPTFPTFPYFPYFSYFSYFSYFPYLSPTYYQQQRTNTFRIKLDVDKTVDSLLLFPTFSYFSLPFPSDTHTLSHFLSPGWAESRGPLLLHPCFSHSHTLHSAHK